jgi:hypothetical protein
VLSKWNSVFQIEEPYSESTKIPNLFKTPYHLLAKYYYPFLDSFFKFTKSNQYNRFEPASYQPVYLECKVKIFADLTHATEVGRHQVMMVAKMDTQSLVKKK